MRVLGLGAIALLLGLAVIAAYRQSPWESRGSSESHAGPYPTARPALPGEPAPTPTVEWAAVWGGFARFAPGVTPPDGAAAVALPATDGSEPEQLPPPPPPPTEIPLPTATPVPEPVSRPDLADHLTGRMNQARIDAGLAPLAPDAALSSVATDRSFDMARRGYFSHTSPEGLTSFDLLSAAGVAVGGAAENLARNNYPESATVDQAAQEFLAGEGHRANILSTAYTKVGVGVVQAHQQNEGQWSVFYIYTIIFSD